MPKKKCHRFRIHCVCDNCASAHISFRSQWPFVRSVYNQMAPREIKEACKSPQIKKKNMIKSLFLSNLLNGNCILALTECV